MKKIDLTVRVHRVTPQRGHGMRPMPMQSNKLLTDVIAALVSYTGVAIYEANDIITFINELKANPVCEIDEAKLMLIEAALGNANVEVKATWATMINKLNKEG
jgi:hypothetical protein